MGYLPKRTECREWNKPKKGICVTGSETGVMEPAKSFDVRDENIRFEDFPARF